MSWDAQVMGGIETKLSERMPDTNYVAGLGEWLKELAEYVEFTDRRDRLAYRDLRERVSVPAQEEYQPQTYDEAIALCKGWKRCVVDGFVHWETPTGAWWMIDPNDEVGFCEADYENYNFSWERHKWPDLWKEMVEDGCVGHLYLYKGKWTLTLPGRHEDSTPGRVVCKAYLVYKGHPDWAERLSKNG